MNHAEQTDVATQAAKDVAGDARMCTRCRR